MEDKATMKFKNIEPPKQLLDLKIPKYSKEQKIVKKALDNLYKLGAPVYSVTQNRTIRKLSVKDETTLAYVCGLLESLLMEKDGENDGNN